MWIAVNHDVGRGTWEDGRCGRSSTLCTGMGHGARHIAHSVDTDGRGKIFEDCDIFMLVRFNVMAFDGNGEGGFNGLDLS